MTCWRPVTICWRYRNAPAAWASRGSAWAVGSHWSCRPGFCRLGTVLRHSLPRELSETLGGACPIVASFGGRDPLGVGAPKKLQRVLDQKGITNDVKVYPGAGHSFANNLPAQPLLRIAGFGYSQAATEDAWARVFAFFGEHLREPA